MKIDRPGSVGLWDTIRFNLSLVPMVSITHRVSGMLLFGGVAFALFLLDMAMTSEAGFDEAKLLLQQTFPKGLMLLLLATLMFHVFVGLKHLLLDLHIGDTVTASRLGSRLVLLLTAASVIILYLKLW
tara:strand:+ start:108 stop:491 length:384 start_codon:yes stop_codon:yes gene_type:complete